MSVVQAAQKPVERYWPGPGGRASPRSLASIAGAAVVGGATLTLSRPGLDWLIAGLAVAAAAIVVDRATRPYEGATARGPRRRGWAAASLALLAVGTLRAEGWIGGYCLLAAIGTGSVALAGGRTLKGFFLGACAAPVAAARALPWVGRGAAGLSLARPRGGPRLGRTLLISAALLLVFGGLFASADAAFASLAGRLAPSVDAGGVFRVYLGVMVVGLLAAGAAYLRAAPPRLDHLPPVARREVRRLEWALPVAALDLLFLAFVLVQLAVLFGGRDRVLRTADLTYAQYARGGFWQLVTVTVLTLAVIGVVGRIAPRRERTDRILIRVLLGTLAGLSLVIVASAIKRLAVYEEAYGFTRLRVLVGATELWLGLLFGLVLVAGVRLGAWRGELAGPRSESWLPRVVTASAVIALLAVAVADPDRFVADRNVDRFEQTHQIDLDYLSRLSPDAVPALMRLPYKQRSCVLAPIADRLDQEPDDWRSWNLGRYRARGLIASITRPTVLDCWPYS